MKDIATISIASIISLFNDESSGRVPLHESLGRVNIDASARRRRRRPRNENMNAHHHQRHRQMSPIV